jgi:hypothetical protein
MNEKTKEVALLKKMKNVTKEIYSLIINKDNILQIDDINYFDVYVECDLLFDSILKPMNDFGLDKSLFLDFMNFQLQVNYCFEMIVNKEMTTPEINILMDKEKDYLNFTFSAITNLNLSEL